MKIKIYKIKLSRQMVEGIHDIIKMLVESDVVSDDDKLHFAVLSEVMVMMHDKLEKVQQVSKFSFSPSQAFALRILATDYVTNLQSYTGNRLHQIANEVHRLYQTP